MEWANTNAKEAQTHLPRLVRRLCFDPAATRQLSFPAGDSTYVPGWDGVLFSEKGDAWVPAGKSYWEIGCDQEPTAKANRDYKKRSKQDDVEDRASATFIFVTPRRWTAKPAWIAEQQAKGDWADVRAYDADDLEQWLEHTPAVALQFKEELRLSGEGVQSLSRYWQLWSQQCNPAITPDALFIDRIEIRDNLIEKIQKGLTQQDAIPPLTIRADSVEEAVAFAVATLKHAGELADQALVVTTPDGWRFVEANQQLKVVIAARTEVATTPTLRAGLLVIIPHAAGDVAGKPQGEEVLLERPNIYEFEKALIAIGMEESDAKRYALSTGRSWTVFRRQRATNPAIRLPGWLDAPQSGSLSLLCLLGAWNAGKKADRQMVERLADKPYEEVERNLRQLAQLDDAPLLSIGTVWKAKSPLELLSLFGDRITRSELDRFFSIAQEMLTATDPQLELPDEQRYAAAIYGKVHPYSGLLFDSVCDALMKLAVRGPDQPGLRALEIDARVGQFVRELLDSASAERWLSLASHLPTLAEAAPTVFLSAVEKSLRLPEAPVTKLLTESSTSGFGGRCWHAGLLWALETLAWAPNLLARVALLLAQLSHVPVPVKGGWSNKPSRSLFGLFRSWLPQTAAGLPERIKVLDLLIQKDSEAAFCILEGLTAPGEQMAKHAERPKWREDDAGAGHGVTDAEINEMCGVAREQLFRLSVGHPSRIASLLENIRRTEREEIGSVLALMEPFIQPTANDQDREVLRAALRETIHWHRNYDETQMTELDAWLLPMEVLYEQLAPVNLVLRHCWLFNSYWVALPSRDGDDPVDDRGDLLAQARTAALTEIQQSLGMAGIESLILACADPGTLGATLAGINCDEVDWSEWIFEKGEDFTPGVHMTWCISGFLCALPAARTTELLQKVMKLGGEQGWNTAKRVRLLVLARPEQEVWELAAACGTEVDAAYWAFARFNTHRYKDETVLAFVLRRLLDAKRPRTALQLGQYSLKLIDDELLYAMLLELTTVEEPDGPILTGWHLGRMLDLLEKSCRIEKIALMQLEFRLFPALGDRQEAKAATLFAELMTKPAIFSELISLCYRPEHGNTEGPITESTQAAVLTSFEILQACKRQPGTQADGSIDHEAFTQFIDAARELCRQKDRLIMCDQTLGEILAHTPPDEDGTWPFLPAREVLDRVDMEEMRKGFSRGSFNKRGVTSRSLWAGGEQERDLAIYYRSQGERVQYSYPNVTAMLEEIAKSYECDGKDEDFEANLRKEGF